MSEVIEGVGEDRRPYRGPIDEAAEPVGSQRRGIFNIYKLGQGTHTRIGTAVALGVMVIWLAVFLHEKLSVVSTNPATARLWQVGAAIAVIAIFGAVGYWLLGLNRKVCDFLIATESEMKKVSWTSRKDIVGSTKVVVFVVIVLSILLFVVDIGFMIFFTKIGVLKGAEFLDSLWKFFRG